MYTKIARPAPVREGAPRINAPKIFGVTPKREVLWHLPVAGERPMSFEASGLPEGLYFDAEGNLHGRTEVEGDFAVEITVRNARGEAKHSLTLRVGKDAKRLTPLMGWCSWNAFQENINEQVITGIADAFIEKGLIEYGYQFVNLDSEWQGQYGGELNAIQPNLLKFPDIKRMVDNIHARGIKCGIYSTPMLRSYNNGSNESTLPGCTRGKRDESDNVKCPFGIGKVHLEENNVKQWCEWGFDYLKYDWGPYDFPNAEKMRKAIDKCADRDIIYCPVTGGPAEARKQISEIADMWRWGPDSKPNFQNLLSLCFGRDECMNETRLGHFFDLDMLEIGELKEWKNELTEDEMVIAYTQRAICSSPIQLSCDVRALTDFELSLFCNEEVIAVNQDSLGRAAFCITEYKTRNEATNAEEKHTKVYKKPLSDGSYAVAVYNLGCVSEEYTLECSYARDLWAKEDLAIAENPISFTLAPHTVKLFKIK